LCLIAFSLQCPVMRKKTPAPIKTYFLVKEFLEETGMLQSKFGMAAVGDPNLFRHLQDGKDITTRKDEKIRVFIHKHRQAATCRQDNMEAAE
jgi:hypothetical protein